MNKTQQLIRERKRKFKEQFITPRGLLNCYATNNTNLVLDFNDETISLLLNSLKEEVDSKLREIKPLYTFGDVVIDSKRAQDGTILGQQKSLIDISTLLSQTISNIQTK